MVVVVVVVVVLLCHGSTAVKDRDHCHRGVDSVAAISFWTVDAPLKVMDSR